MMFEYFGYELEVPDHKIKDYTERFKVLAQDDLPEELYILRESIFTIMELIEMAPNLLDESKYYEEFTNALAMKEALFNNKVLHNA